MKKLLCTLLALTLLMSVCSAALAEGGSLVAHYDFEDIDNPGKDVTGNGNDLILVGSGKLTAAKEAVVGSGAIALDGECGLAYSKENGDDFTDNLESFTVSFYAKHQGYTGENTRVFSTGYNGEQKGVCLLVAAYAHNKQKHLIYQPIIGDGVTDHWAHLSESCKLTEDLDAYHWYVCAYDAETMTMTAWVDGEMRGTDEYEAPQIPCVMGVTIGGSYVFWDDRVMYGFIGEIDDVRVYDYAIEDVSEIYGE